MPKQELRMLSAAKVDILDADLFLLRAPKSIVSWFVKREGRGLYSHAMKASWIKGEIFCPEVREWHGGRIVSLQSQVDRYPGLIDVYRTNAIETPLYDRMKADKLMLMFAGVEYDYLGILQTWAIHHLLKAANVDDDFVSKRPPFCSSACAIADRVGGGVDPVPNLCDSETEPSDLARSPFYRYLFTLIPDEPPKQVSGNVPETNKASEMMAKAKAEGPPVLVTDIAGGSAVVKPVEDKKP